jgi:hypothetical protein
MSVSNSVTEKGVTVTASASEDEIRAAAFPTPDESGAPAETTGAGDGLPDRVPADELSESEPVPPTTEVPRHADGTFKQKDGDPRKSFQAKINEERRLRGDAERRAAALEAQLAATTETPPGEAGSPGSRPAPSSPTYLDLVKAYQADPGWPKLEDFVEAGFGDPYAACTAAQSAFMQDRRLQERDAEIEARSAEETVRRRIHDAHVDGAEKYADWGELFASDAAQVNLPPAVLNELYDDPSSSADVIHHLLTHPEVLEGLVPITEPIAAARALTLLKAGLSSASSGPETAPRIPVTRAKPLIKPVSASPVAPEAKSIDDLPFNARYVRETAQQERRWRDARRGV